MLTGHAVLSMVKSRSGQLTPRCALLHSPRLKRQSGVSNGFPRLLGQKALPPEVRIGVLPSTGRLLVVEHGLDGIASVPVLGLRTF